MHTSTYHGLHEWTKAMFEKLGWMILAHRDGRKSKVEEYKKSLRYLKESLEKKVESTQDVDRKEDLLILHKNVLTLIEHVSKEYPTRK